jgi:hypothetical protein
MKIRLLSALAGLAIGFAMPAIAQEQNTVDAEARQQIEAAFTRYMEAYNNYDAPGVAAFYTLNAVEVLGETGVAVGQQAIEKRYAVMFASQPGKQSANLFRCMQSATRYVRSRISVIILFERATI